MENKKKVVYIVLSVLILIIIAFGVSYAWFTLTLHGTKTQVIKTGGLELILNDVASEGITLNNAAPIPDSDGLGTYSYKFTLKNTGSLDSKYALNLVDQTITGTRMPDTAVKYWFKKGNSIQGPILLSTLTNRTLDSGVLKVGESISYELKLWIDYDAGNEVQGTKFNAKISVTGEQIVPTDSRCFAFDSATNTITGYKCYAGNTYGMPTVTDLVIPSQISGVSVKKIGDFSRKGLTSVVFPEGIQEIGPFIDNQLTDLIVPSSVTGFSQGTDYYSKYNEVGHFSGNQLTSVIIMGKSDSSKFYNYGDPIYSISSPFQGGWASGYSDDNIVWKS